MDGRFVARICQSISGFWNGDQGASIVVNGLPEPHKYNYRHHEWLIMVDKYGKSRCEVFHLCYWIPQAQNTGQLSRLLIGIDPC